METPSLTDADAAIIKLCGELGMIGYTHEKALEHGYRPAEFWGQHMSCATTDAAQKILRGLLRDGKVERMVVKSGTGKSYYYRPAANPAKQ